MIFEKVEAGRGGDLAPAPEDVSADTPNIARRSSRNKRDAPRTYVSMA